jgi:hypothetical protein
VRFESDFSSFDEFLLNAATCDLVNIID